LRTHVEFRSDAFPSEPGEEEEINPGRWGIALARYLRVELTARGFTGKDPFFEDWGCCIPLDNEGFSLWIGCGNYGDYDDGFLCFIQPRKPFVWRLFRKLDASGRIAAVADALDSALRSHPSIRDIRWWTDSEADAGT